MTMSIDTKMVSNLSFIQVLGKKDIGNTQFTFALNLFFFLFFSFTFFSDKSYQSKEDF